MLNKNKKWTAIGFAAVAILGLVIIEMGQTSKMLTGDVSTVVNSLAPVSWWKADGTTADAKNIANGTIQGGVTFDAGKSGQAFKFNGTNGTISALNGNLASPVWTLDTWINRTRPAVASGVTETLIARANNYHLNIKPDGTLDALFADGSYAIKRATTTATVPVNVWTNVAATFDGSFIKIYINGSLSATSSDVSPSTPLINNSLPTYLGSLAGAGSYFNGLMDDASIYKRALSASDIQNIYAQYATAVSTSEGPKPASVFSKVASPTTLTFGENTAYQFSVTAPATGSVAFTRMAINVTENGLETLDQAKIYRGSQLLGQGSGAMLRWNNPAYVNAGGSNSCPADTAQGGANAGGMDCGNPSSIMSSGKLLLDFAAPETIAAGTTQTYRLTLVATWPAPTGSFLSVKPVEASNNAVSPYIIHDLSGLSTNTLSN